MQGILDRISTEAREGTITGEDARPFSFGAGDLENLDFEKLVLGMRLEFEPADSTARHVRPAHDQISAAAAATLMDDNKAVNLETDQTQVPTRAVEEDSVDESSWESFPASDPPAAKNIT